MTQASKKSFKNWWLITARPALFLRAVKEEEDQGGKKEGF